MPEVDRDSLPYTLGFAAAVCLVCAVVVSSAAVALRPLQERNQRVDRLSKVLEVAGLMEPDEALSDREILRRFEERVQPRAIDLRTGQHDRSMQVEGYNPREAAQDPETSYPAPENEARVLRLPERALVYQVMKDGKLDALVLPIRGYGLWSTMHGYLALEADGRTIAGITFYEHGETPGLGGEIDNPRWQARWKNRLAFDEEGEVAIRVVKGRAGPADEFPYQVDGLSGATITSRGVSNAIAFWLGEHGYGPYLQAYRAQRDTGSSS